MKESPPKLVVFFTYPGCQLLDFSGPADVFATANSVAKRQIYRTVCVSTLGGSIPTTSIDIFTSPLSKFSGEKIDTLLLSGAPESSLRELAADKKAERWLKKMFPMVRRFGSVCSGALPLAHWGLLDGAKVATHWTATDYLSRNYKKVKVTSEALYLEDGKIWTSGGVTAGIDMALQMVEQDTDRMIAGQTAKQLILFARRPGNQSQFSYILDSQSGTFSELIDWVRNNLTKPLDVDALSAKAGQSVRSFHRHFVKETGKTPAEFVEAIRIDTAKLLLESGKSVKTVARECGYSSLDHLSRSFKRNLMLTPTEYQQLHKFRN